MPLTDEEITRRFGSTAKSPEGTARQHLAMSNMFADVASTLNQVLDDGRETSLALTHLEEAKMWAQKSLSYKLRKD